MLTVLTVINVLLIAYLFLLSLRIVVGWFAPHALGKAWDVLAGATDPYLRVFGRIGFLRGGIFDFSPIAALLVLVVALDLVNQLLFYGRISLGFFLASAFSAVWSGARFLLLLFLVVGVLRTIPIIFRVTAGAGLWKAVDLIIQPVVAWVAKLFRLGIRASHVQRLLFTLGMLFVVFLFGELLLVPNVVELFLMLPI
jgi:YggT family protein